MEVINTCLVIWATLGFALSQQGLSDGPRDDYQEAVDKTIAMVEVSSDLTNEVAQDAVVKIEDIVNTLSFATAEARFSLVHLINFATLNNEDDPPSSTCVGKVMEPIKEIATRVVHRDMVKCFSDKVAEAEVIHRDTLALGDKAADIMPNALDRIDKCSQSRDINCVNNERTEILRGSATIEDELEQNVIRTEELLGTLHYDVTQCLGELAAVFVADVGKFGSKMLSCLMN